MKKIYIKLIIAFILIFILKSILSSFILAPSEFADGYIYAKAARSFFFNQELTIHEEIPLNYPPLYSIILSISYLFKNMNYVYLFMKMINAFISSLIVFPAFFLAREFLSNKKSFLFSILISFLPSNFSFSPYIMSENLFYPLFLTSIYFIYKSFKEEKLRYDIIASIFIALSYLTRVLSLVLLLVVGLLVIINIIKRSYNIKKLITKSLAYIIPFILITIPWLIRNLLVFDEKKGFITNYYRTSFLTSINIDFFIWVLLYIGLITIASGVIFLFIYLITIKDFLKDKNLSLLSIISLLTLSILILVSAKYSSYGIIKSAWALFNIIGRPIGRYIDAVLPLIILLGFIGTTFYRKIKDKIIITNIVLISIILIVSTRLIFFPLFPLNNMSLAWIGTLKYLIDLIFYNKQNLEITFSLASFIIFILLFLLIPIIISIAHYKRKLTIKNIFIFFIIFFLSVSLLNYGLTYYNSRIWYEGEQMQLGLWFNEYDKKISNILIDERDCTGKILKENQSTLCEPSKSATIIGFWLNDNIIIGDVSNLDNTDFVITKHKMNLELVRETNSGIKIYKV